MFYGLYGKQIHIHASMEPMVQLYQDRFHTITIYPPKTVIVCSVALKWGAYLYANAIL